MRSLAVKLTMAFLLVGLTGALLVALLVRRYTQREFDRLILDQNQQALVTYLTRYYQINGNWQGVDTIFRNSPENGSPRNPESRWEIRRNLFSIADSNGMIVLGSDQGLLGRKLPNSDLRKGVPLEVDNQTVGWLLFTPALDRWRADTPEGNFLLGVNRAIFLSALIATAIALLLGGILAYTMTRSLRELTHATDQLAQGKLGYQVEVRSQDEIGELATSFNQMSSELARSTELRRKMTADIAHDLRSPLSVILGYSEALSDGKLTPNPEMFAVLHTEAKHLNLLVDDLKTLSLADAGELPLNYQPIVPEVLLQRAANAHRVQAEFKNITIAVEISPDLPEVSVDVERMAQVLGNLMSNALRYTNPGGRITLTAAKSGNQVMLIVADNGAGITPENLPFIFERSFRGDKARQHLEGETGLGLAIAKSLVEAQGGAISVKSEVDKGTTFTILLPANG
jgi:two-component system, OmpR family, sensor histidine kinase BaeS